VPGEPLERVDWKSTAKTGSVMLREMEADTEHDLTLLLDAPAARSKHASRDEEAAHEEAFETAVVAAGSIAAFTLRSGHAASLLLPDAGWRDLRLTPDAASRRRLLAALAEAGPRRHEALGSSLPAVLGSRRRGRMLVLVTTRVDERLLTALGALRGRGMAVSVVHIAAAGDRADGGLGRGDGVDVVLAAAGARYFPVAGRRDLREALAARKSDNLTRAR
jgi:uncharacterized protein (DUF58 family)